MRIEIKSKGPLPFLSCPRGKRGKTSQKKRANKENGTGRMGMTDINANYRLYSQKCQNSKNIEPKGGGGRKEIPPEEGARTDLEQILSLTISRRERSAEQAMERRWGGMSSINQKQLGAILFSPRRKRTLMYRKGDNLKVFLEP